MIMATGGLIYLAFEFSIFLVVMVISVIIGSRYIKNRGKSVPGDFEKTTEVTVDPGDGKTYRVYYNKKNGKRFYLEEGRKESQ